MLFGYQSCDEVFMKNATKYILAILLTGYYVGCAKKKFVLDEAKVQESCQASNGCLHQNGKDVYDYKTTVGGGQVDILIVDDNSGSMSFEQNHMSERFANFLEALEAKSIDYRIAVTTTDISTAENPNRTINRNGALQDGKLIQLPDGSYFLTPTSGTGSSEAEKKQKRIEWFSGVIQRPETNTCEAFLRANPTAADGSTAYQQSCPSGDERGIYASNLVVQQNPQSFIRPKAHFAVVFLSDEDTRSSNYYKTNSLVLNTLDLPQTLIDNTKSLYPDKTLSAHSIIVRPGALKVSTDEMSAVLADLMNDPVNAGYHPADYFQTGDSTCLAAQSNQIPGTFISGSYGYTYAVLTRITGGIEGDICANDYAGQLSTIGANISERVQEIGLRCDNPSDLKLTLSQTPANFTYTLEGSTVKFNQVLTVGTQLSLSYSCPSVY